LGWEFGSNGDVGLLVKGLTPSSTIEAIEAYRWSGQSVDSGAAATARMMWLLAGYLSLVLSAVLAWIMVQLGSPQSAILVGLLGATIDIALIGRGVWIYIRVMRMRAHDRVGTSQPP
jgi:hypothetical protein